MSFRFGLLMLAGLLISLALPATAAADKLAARDHSIAMLLLGNSDDSLKLGGKSVIWFSAQKPQLTDILAEVVWQACSGKRQMDPDTLAWLSKAVGSTKQLRYAEVLETCLNTDIASRTRGHIAKAKSGLTEASADAFKGGGLDLSLIRAGLTQPRTVGQNQLAQGFRKLQKDAALEEVYTSLGLPDEIDIGTVSASNRLMPYVWLTALKLTYKGVGQIQFYAEEGATDWQLDNAVTDNGLMLTSYDGRFYTITELIARGNAMQLREVGDYLVGRKSLSNEEYDAIMKRDNAPLDPADERLADSLGWLERAALADGNASHERAMTMSLLERGDGLQLRHTAEHWLAKDTADSEVVDAMMARINTSFETTDGKLADGLAYLCKVIQKSGNAKYNLRMRELSEAAPHKTLRKYAGLAAKVLN
ncbi:MAG: hypothetical protein Q7U91_16335 [Sideroxyarcus sp.]|nr:hypothetical protein [Sideroxyarcus sp.]